MDFWRIEPGANCRNSTRRELPGRHWTWTSREGLPGTSSSGRGSWSTEPAAGQGAGAAAGPGATARTGGRRPSSAQRPKTSASSAKSSATGILLSYPRSNECPKGDGSGVRSGKCFLCNKRGHLAKACTKGDKRDGSGSKSKRKSPSSKNEAYGRKQERLIKVAVSQIKAV